MLTQLKNSAVVAADAAIPPTELVQPAWQYAADQTPLLQSDPAAASKIRNQVYADCMNRSGLTSDQCACVAEQFLRGTDQREAWIVFTGNIAKPLYLEEAKLWYGPFAASVRSQCRADAARFMPPPGLVTSAR